MSENTLKLVAEEARFVELGKGLSDMCTNIIIALAKAAPNGPDAFMDEAEVIAQQIMNNLATNPYITQGKGMAAVLIVSHATMLTMLAQYQQAKKDGLASFPCLERELKAGRLHIDANGDVHTHECEVFAPTKEEAEAKLIQEMPTC